MNSRRLAGILAVILAAAMALATGCRSIRDVDRSGLLQEALIQYAAAIRWGHINTANSFLRAPDGTLLAGDKPFREDVRVTGYRTLNRVPLGDERVQVEARLEFMSQNTGQIITVDEVQLWWYDADARRWFLDGPLPAVLVAP